MNPWQSLIDPASAMPRAPVRVTVRKEPRGKPGRKVACTPGDVVGQWTLVEFIPGTKEPKVHPRWRCQCSCGKIRLVRPDHLANGTSTSCGHGRAAAMSEAMRRYHARVAEAAA